MQNKLPAWDDLRVLLAIHRHGTMLAAGQALGLSTSTVARRIGALERDMGVALVHRTTQGSRLEAEALALVALAQGFEQSLAAHRRGGGQRTFSGVVRISLPDGFMAAAAEAANRFCRQHPETFIEAVSELRFVDLVAREADIGVRSRRSSSPVLVDRPLGAVDTGLYASEEYVARRLPSRFLGAGDYAAQDFVVDDASDRAPTRWLVDRGARRFPFRSNAFEARLLAARGGRGLVMCGVGEATRHPELVPIDLAAPLPSISFFLTMHREVRKVPRIKGFAAALEAVFAEVMLLQTAARAALAARRSSPPAGGPGG